jgi:hypothetical protein
MTIALGIDASVGRDSTTIRTTEIIDPRLASPCPVGGSHGPEPPGTTAEEFEMALVMTLDRAMVADADHDGIR